MGEPAKKERLESEGEQKTPVLIAQVSWSAHVWNSTPERAAQQIVADLFKHLSGGGPVQVHVEESGGKEYMLEVTARRQ